MNGPHKAAEHTRSSTIDRPAAVRIAKVRPRPRQLPKPNPWTHATQFRDCSACAKARAAMAGCSWPLVDIATAAAMSLPCTLAAPIPLLESRLQNRHVASGCAHVSHIVWQYTCNTQRRHSQRMVCLMALADGGSCVSVRFLESPVRAATVAARQPHRMREKQLI